MAVYKVEAEDCRESQDDKDLQTVAGVAAVRLEGQMTRTATERWVGHQPYQWMVVRRMAPVVLVVRSPWLAHVVDMIDGHCGSIDAEVPEGEAMMSADALRSYTRDQGQKLDEAVACSTKEQEIERVTALDANHTSHFDEAAETRHFDDGRQNSRNHEDHEGREGREDHDCWMPKVVVWVQLVHVVVGNPDTHDDLRLEHCPETE